MVTVFITSSEKGSGKTAVGAGLGKHLISDGKKVGFFKPIIADSSQPDKVADSDVTFMKQLLSHEESVDMLCPVFNDESSLNRGIKDAFNKVAQGKDVVIMEGASSHLQAYPNVVKALGARVIAVENYSKEPLQIANAYKDFSQSLLGILINRVPKSRIDQAHNSKYPQLEQAGTAILGILPEDRSLYALTTGELAEYIQGKILSGAEKSSALVENVMLGAMVVDPGPDYFGHKANKAVVLRSERPDMQMAALETSTSCLVLTGDTVPNQVVLHHAEEKSVPVIFTSDSITSIVTNIEGAFGKTRFNQENKLPKITEIMGQYFNFDAAYQELGLAS